MEELCTVTRCTNQASRLGHLAVIALCIPAVVPVTLESRESAFYQAAPAGRRQAPAPKDAVQPGQEDFDRVCKTCHGAEARGDAGPRLVPFTREYEELLGIVREGSGQMPPIAARELPDEGVMRIFAYLKHLSRERHQEPQHHIASPMPPRFTRLPFRRRRGATRRRERVAVAGDRLRSSCYNSLAAIGGEAERQLATTRHI